MFLERWSNKFNVLFYIPLLLTTSVLVSVGSSAAVFTVKADKETVGKYQVIELTITNPGQKYNNVWENVHITAGFTSPSKKKILAGGFYHSRDTWKVRFAPSEIGPYAWQLRLQDGKAEKSAQGSFACAASQEKGFVRH